MSNQKANPNATAAPAADPNFVALDEPLRRGDQEITGVTLRKPRTGELRGVPLAQLLQLDVGALQTVLPRITTPTLTAHDVGNLDPADLLAVATVLSGFFMTKAERASLPA
ncbi:phage tail assembly protein [Pseudoxanthomonas wuyuanensis]|uniref:Phage tail assembly chaperone protein, E, or 41 or 14 n=1 Tax=Pseudoxanthomonas wuyuanensis TaxID=1073196 RepID=A0A286D4S9_9GAMM|nr:phage tail assembly protein [Pseudoxanthomonas wuyuanensis]KAF1719798.1 phage tail assembly protein [Pseudoxanthomonas wuyuanensis]SOD53659.1 Phage tail assembly chaperone protein, E, or 41 or 14 [Pseudoxanthomonas wuyuanensis]